MRAIENFLPFRQAKVGTFEGEQKGKLRELMPDECTFSLK